MLTHGTPTVTEIAEESTPEEIVAWTLRRFAGRNLVVSTSFGMEGCALIDMVARHGVSVPVIYLDTMFLFPETYALRDRMVARYPHLRFENRGTSLTPEAQAERFGPELWRRDPNTCCALRKVEPMRQALAGVEVWVTGLMRSQGGERGELRELQWNETYERGYPTLGCTHCTAAVPGAGPRDYTRIGRWAGTDKTECGLHADSSRQFARKA
jgi:phosphoadenosine phosphosulfate reductase